MGQLHESGKFGPINYVLAYKWFSTASIQGDKEADEGISRLENKISTSQIEKAKQMAKKQSLKSNNTQKLNLAQTCQHFKASCLVDDSYKVEDIHTFRILVFNIFLSKDSLQSSLDWCTI